MVHEIQSVCYRMYSCVSHGQTRALTNTQPQKYTGFFNTVFVTPKRNLQGQI